VHISTYRLRPSLTLGVVDVRRRAEQTRKFM
jgi:hypothetical protein